MLRGRYTATVDTKGRLKIPTAFKSQIDESYGPDFYITSFDGKHARLYPLPEWQRIEERLAALPETDKTKDKMLVRTSYWGQTARMDPQGRVLMPAQLREDAAVRGEVVVMGYLKYLQVWNPERLREHLEQEPLTDSDLEKLSGRNI